MNKFTKKKKKDLLKVCKKKRCGYVQNVWFIRRERERERERGYS
jgi:hypothetical protein